MSPNRFESLPLPWCQHDLQSSVHADAPGRASMSAPVQSSANRYRLLGPT